MAKKETYLTGEGPAKPEGELDHLRLGRRVVAAERLHSLRGLAGVGETRALVGAAEADAVHGGISNESAVGSAGLDRKVGDTANVAVPDDAPVYTIAAVE